MTNDLKPCPFCGGAVKYNFNVELEPDGIICLNCRYVLRFMKIRHKPHNAFEVVMTELADAWNRRVKE